MEKKNSPEIKNVSAELADLETRTEAAAMLSFALYEALQGGTLSAGDYAPAALGVYYQITDLQNRLNALMDAGLVTETQDA